MIRNLVRTTLQEINNSNAVIASYRRLSLCRFHSVRRCDPRHPLRSVERAGYLPSYRDTLVRMSLRTNSSTSPPTYSNPPFVHVFDDIFVHGPNVRKKVKKLKKKKPKKIEPPVPMDTIEQASEKLKTRFDEIEKEHLGPKRGIMTVKGLAGPKGEKLHKVVSTKMANTILNSWVYCRHALLHGHYQLTDMNRKKVSESLLGKGTKTKVTDRDARLILKELFRYGKSNLFDQYKTLHLDKIKLMKREAASAERNKMGGIPKIRSIATVEEMNQHGYLPDDIDFEMASRMKKLEKRQKRRWDTDMPAYLRHEVSGAKRQEAKKVKRLLERRERNLLRSEPGYDGSSSASDSEPVMDDDDDSDEGSECDSDDEGDYDNYDDDDMVGDDNDSDDTCNDNDDDIVHDDTDDTCNNNDGDNDVTNTNDDGDMDHRIV